MPSPRPLPCAKPSLVHTGVWGCTSESKSRAEWGGNSAKGDSLLNILQLQNVCHWGSEFKDSRKEGKGQNGDQKSQEVRERRK